MGPARTLDVVGACPRRSEPRRERLYLPSPFTLVNRRTRDLLPVGPDINQPVDLPRNHIGPPQWPRLALGPQRPGLCLSKMDQALLQPRAHHQTSRSILLVYRQLPRIAQADGARRLGRIDQ